MPLENYWCLNFMNKGSFGIVANPISIEAHSLPNIGSEDPVGLRWGPECLILQTMGGGSCFSWAYCPWFDRDS